ncbi:hypothetical protein LEP1GSC050_3397 [Leptospira broomii serovar Hurstbridge str. 5399]|uniref:Uncharacterized protein n=1 Tax=Leptospira broomii serovar Hurstbridge str. 5399 TaxID=1049789 RepID=T0FB73_9LEPT|nr:hypothetical protein LEP1GSC050_3397 [Leptospira broomii serovar Hurstbridge str. 5399]
MYSHRKITAFVEFPRLLFFSGVIPNFVETKQPADQELRTL